MQKQRLIWADSLKGWLILLVILGHAIQLTLGNQCNNDHLWNLIYSFHMSAFMAVSGWFAFRPTNKEIDLKKTVGRRFMQLLVPYFIWSVLSFAFRGTYTLDSLAMIVLQPDNYFWFLWVLFWIYCIFLAAKKLANYCHINEIKIILPVCILLMGIMVGLDLRVLGFQFISYYFLFYTLGYCLHRYPSMIVTNKFIIGSMGVIWMIMAWYWTMHELPSWFPVIPHVPQSLLQYAYRGLTAFIAIVLILSVSDKLLNSSNRFNGIIAELGIYSLGMYIIHLILMGYIIKGLNAMLPNQSVILMELLSFTICTSISITFVAIIRKNELAAKMLLGKI